MYRLSKIPNLLQIRSITTLHNFKVADYEGIPVDLGQRYKGKVVIVANVATRSCSAWANYSQLKVILDKYYAEGLRVALFPCNDLFCYHQMYDEEPASNAEILDFIQKEFHFDDKADLYSKIHVNEPHAHPLYKFLKQYGLAGYQIKRNFTKFLIGKDGNIIKTYVPPITPSDMVVDIEAALHDVSLNEKTTVNIVTKANESAGKRLKI